MIYNKELYEIAKQVADLQQELQITNAIKFWEHCTSEQKCGASLLMIMQTYLNEVKDMNDKLSV